MTSSASDSGSNGNDRERAEPARRTRRRTTLSIIGALGAALLIFVLVYFEPHKAFIDDTVNETIPGLDAVLANGTTPPAAADPAVTTQSTTAETATAETATAETATAPETTVAATQTPVESTTTTTTTVATTAAPAPANSVSAGIAQAMSTGQPVVLSTAEFFSGEHSTTGTALVVALPDGSLVVRFEGLDTSNGPDLRVVLSPDEASESWEYSDRLILDELKGNIGDQNYELGADVDLTSFRSVVIWCERFSVAFGAASIDVQL